MPAIRNSPYLPDGTLAAPGARFVSEASGMYKYAASELGFGVAGLHLFRMFRQSGASSRISNNTAQFIDFGDGGNLSLLAGGANQQVNITPSGTAGVVLKATSAIKGVRTATATLDFPSIPATGGTQSLTVTVTGAAVGDAVYIGLPAAPNAGVVFNAFVSAADTVTIRATNCTAGAIDPASATYRVTVVSL